VGHHELFFRGPADSRIASLRTAIMGRSPATSRLALSILVIVSGLLAVAPVHAAEDPDSLYFARHPSLLFGPADVPALRARVQTPGAPADAFAFITELVHNAYTTVPFDTLLDNDYGQEPIVNLALTAYLSEPTDVAAL